MVLGDVTFMDELPPLLKERLEAADATPPTIVDRQLSADGTRKYVLEFADGTQVEAVGARRLPRIFSVAHPSGATRRP